MSIRTHIASLAVGGAVTIGSLFVATVDARAGDRSRDWGYSDRHHGYNWSGLYFGGSLGGAWGDSSFVFANGNPADPNPVDFDGSFAGGVHLGLQHQWGNFVLGIETSVRAGSGYLNRFSASISGASAGVRLPCGVAAG